MRAVFALMTVALTVSVAPVLAASNPETIEIPQKGNGHLKASLFRPEGEGPFPAVIGLHNCTGLHSRSGAMGSRYRDWGQQLAKNGFNILFPDSNGSRGLGSLCGVRSRTVRVDHERVSDANAARAGGQ